MAEGIRSWSTTAASNASADSTINWAENQSPSTVNNSARAMMAQIKKWLLDLDGSITSGGSSNAYTVTTNTTYSALEHGLTIAFKANHANTTTATLTVTPGGGAAFATKAIRVFRDGVVDAVLVGGEIPAFYTAIVKYDSAAQLFILLNPSRTTSFPLKVTDYGAVSGATTVHAAFQAAYDAATAGQEILVPPGTWNLTSAVTQTTKYVRWVLDQGAHFDTSDAQNAFTGKNAPVNYPVSNEYGYVNIISTDPATQGETYFVQIRDDSADAIDYETQGLWVIAAQYDPRGATHTVHDAVGVGARGYAMVDDSNVYGFHAIALSGTGIDARLVGGEIDVFNTDGGEYNGYDNNQKIGLAIYSTGGNKTSSAIEIGTSNSVFFRGLHFHVNSIDVSAGSMILCDTIYNVKRDGETLIGKSTSDRNDPGVEILADGSFYVSSSGTQSTILTRTGTPGAGTLGQIVFQQKNSSGTVISFANINTSVSVATAGSETTVVGIDGYLAGAAVNMLTLSGSRIGPGVDNAATCGHPSFRYTTVYATTGTINTSDAALKSNVSAVDDQRLDAWGKARAKFFQWQDAIELKGEDKARIHAGWLAQDIVQDFENAGLDPWRLGMFCRDPVTVTEKQKVTRTRTRKEVLPVYDAVGNPVMEDYEERYIDGEESRKDAEGVVRMVPKVKKRGAKRQVFRNTDVEEECEEEISVERETGEYRYGLRYEQCLVMETAWLRRELDRVNKRLTRLENAL